MSWCYYLIFFHSPSRRSLLPRSRCYGMRDNVLITIVKETLMITHIPYPQCSLLPGQPASRSWVSLRILFFPDKGTADMDVANHQTPWCHDRRGTGQEKDCRMRRMDAWVRAFVRHSVAYTRIPEPTPPNKHAYTFCFILRSTTNRAATAKNAPTSNVAPQNICNPKYRSFRESAVAADWNDSIAPEIGGPARIPGAIAAINIPVRAPMWEWFSVIWATQDEAIDEYEAEVKPNL